MSWKEREVELWLAYRLLRSHGTRFLSFTGWVALGGLVLGVSCLFVSMAVMSGFEDTLKKSITDVTGHVQLLGSGVSQTPFEDMLKQIREIEPSLEGASRFALVEGVLAHQGRLSGVAIQGVDPKEVGNVLNISSRVAEGSFSLGTNPDGVADAMIGKGIAQNFNLKVGDEFKVVIPLATELDPTQFKRRVGRLKVSGILDMGKYEYDARTLIVDLKVSQTLAEIGDRYSGILLKFKDVDRARDIGTKLALQLGARFQVRDWKDVNENLFEAVKYEKVIIFFVIMVIVIAAAFNVASSLYINVIKRYAEVGILKSFGLSQKRVVYLFSVQGLIVGFFGLLGGLLLGGVLCLAFTWAERNFGLIQGSIYKLDRIDITVRFLDTFAIAFATLVVCYLATLSPAKRGARLLPIEGLKND